MAGLADDWEENRQTCVDVLCAYLRMPYEPDPGGQAPGPERLAFRAGREIRHSVVRVITAHVRKGAPVPWRSLNFDFTGVAFDGGGFRGANFSGQVDFSDTDFSGQINFDGAVFSGGGVSFDRARFSSGTVSFDGAEFSGSDVSFRIARFTGGTASWDGAGFSGGTVDFSGSEFTGCQVSFDGARFSGGEIVFRRIKFPRRTISFAAAELSGSSLDFRGTEFSGGEVDFSGAGDWSYPPEFPWTGTPPSGVKLPEKKPNPSRRPQAGARAARQGHDRLDHPTGRWRDWAAALCAVNPIRTGSCHAHEYH